MQYLDYNIQSLEHSLLYVNIDLGHTENWKLVCLFVAFFRMLLLLLSHAGMFIKYINFKNLSMLYI